MRKTYQEWDGPAAVASAAAIGLAGCGDARASYLASMGNSSGNGDTTRTTTLPTGNPNRLLPAANGNGADGVGDGKCSNDPCGAYLIAAFTGLRGRLPPKKPGPGKLQKFSQGMRANGIPDFPDPSSGGLTLHSQTRSDLSPENSTFKNASEPCAKRTGMPFFGNGTPESWSIESLSTGGPGNDPGGKREAGAGT